MLEILVGSIACVIMFVRCFLFLALDEDKKSIQTWGVLVITLAIMVFFDSETITAFVPWAALVILVMIQREPLKEKSMFEDIVPDDSWDDDECETQDRQPAVPTLVYKGGKRV